MLRRASRERLPRGFDGVLVLLERLLISTCFVRAACCPARGGTALSMYRLGAVTALYSLKARGDKDRLTPSAGPAGILARSRIRRGIGLRSLVRSFVRSFVR